MKKYKYAVLVYQAGIANIFKVKCLNLDNYGRDAIKVYQGDFRSAENIAYGMGLGGFVVRTAGCNMAGDITDQKWTEDLENLPFSNNFRPVKMNNTKL